MRKLFYLTLIALQLSLVLTKPTGDSDQCNTKICQKASKVLASYIDTSVDPCDDFYLFACGNFAKQVPLKKDESSTQTLSILSDNNAARSKDLLDNVNLSKHPSKIIRKVKGIYDQCLNESRTNVKKALRQNLIRLMLSERDRTSEAMANGQAKFFVPPNLPNRTSIINSVEVMTDKEICLSNIQYEYDYVFVRIYLDKYLNKKSAEKIRAVINSIYEALLNNVNIPSIDEDERKSYKSQLKKLRRNLVYPDWIVDDAELDSEYEDDTVESVEQLIGSNKRHPSWPMSILTVNAVFVSTNSITIPAGILQDLIYNPGIPPALTHGAGGFISGHEMSHAIRYYLDESEGIQPGLNCIEKQLTDLVEPQSGLSYSSGTYLLSEMLADVGSVNASLNALRRDANRNQTLPGPMAKYTPDQLFWINNADIWCHHSTDEAVESALSSPFGHPFNYHRVIIPALNSPDFAKAFKCPAGSRMNPRAKCSLW